MVNQHKRKKSRVIVPLEEKKIQKEKQRKWYQEKVRNRVQSNTLHFPKASSSDQNTDAILVNQILSEYLSTSDNPIGSLTVGVVNENQENIMMDKQIEQSTENIYRATEVLKNNGIHDSSQKSYHQSLHGTEHASLTISPGIVRGSELSYQLKNKFSLIRNNFRKEYASVGYNQIDEKMQSMSTFTQQDNVELFTKDDLFVNIDQRSTGPNYPVHKKGQTLPERSMEAGHSETFPSADHSDEQFSSSDDNSPLNGMTQFQANKQRNLGK